MKGQWSAFVIAIICAVIVLAFLFFIVLKLIPSISAGINNILKSVMKPICCTMLGCKPAAQAITNPSGYSGDIACDVICWGVC